MKKLLIGFILLLCALTGSGQDKTVRYKTSVIVSPTVNIYQGDVCVGCSNIGYGLSLSSRFPLTKKLLFRPEFDFQHIQSGIDSESDLSFRNNLTGVALNFELGLHKAKVNTSTRSKNALFVFIAPLVYHHNPFYLSDGDKIYLAPLQTEDAVYSKLIPGLKLGFNFNLSANKRSRIGFQVDYTLLFSDYVDDVSTEYIDYSILDPQRAIAVDPTQRAEVGSARGNNSVFDSMIKASLIWEFSFTRVKKVIE